MPLCLKFAVHMYGNGVGSLRVLIRYASGDETIPDQLLWEMSGESGNSWHVAQVPISSPVLSYQVFKLSNYPRTSIISVMIFRLSLKVKSDQIV